MAHICNPIAKEKCTIDTILRCPHLNMLSINPNTKQITFSFDTYGDVLDIFFILNSKKVFNNLLIYRTSGADIKSVTISINKEGCNDISYAPFALFGGSTFSTGTIGKIDNTLKTGNVTIKCNDNGSIQNVKFSNFPQYVNAVIIIYYENIKNAIVKEE